MREIKFRGKRIDNGDWVYGYIQYSEDKLTAWICKSKEDDWTVKNQFPVDPETVGQYTELKDKNQNEIYEDDITWDEQYEEYCVVEFKEGCYWNTGQTSTEQLYERCDQLEVVGNIHDNPEFLK